jgi:cytoskeletal protein RodZ
MKTIFKAACLGLLFAVSCQERNETTTEQQVNTLDANVGHEVPLADAKEWISQYKKKHAGAREASYSIRAAQLRSTLQSVPNPIGVTFHYAIDNNGTNHVIAVALDAHASLWAPSSVAIDANTNTVIAIDQAKAWARRHKQANPNGVWSHSFGMNMIDEITANPAFTYFDIEPAINAIGPQLVLLVWNTGNSGGRTTDGGITPRTYDESRMCPPHCIPSDFI